MKDVKFSAKRITSLEDYQAQRTRSSGNIMKVKVSERREIWFQTRVEKFCSCGQ
jgi:hypothetical protein